MSLNKLSILIKGGGEMASGIAVRLFKSHLGTICMTDLSEPEAVRREVSFCEAIYEGKKTVESITSVRIESHNALSEAWKKGYIPIIVDPAATVRSFLRPDIVIDAILAKKNIGTNITDARLVMGIGPGFCAGKDVHLVVETNRGHNLGRVLYSVEAEKTQGFLVLLAVTVLIEYSEGLQTDSSGLQKPSVI